VALPRTGRAGHTPETLVTYPYKSDRWITPGVVISGLVTAGVLVLATIASVTYLTDRGLDAEPMLKLVGVAMTAASSLGSLLLQLANRRTVTKTERNTGVLASAVHGVAEALDSAAPPPPPPTQLVARPAVPPVRSRHAYPETGAAPSVRE
jgi:hypothetical protein